MMNIRMMLKILDKGQRKKFLFLLFMMFIGAYVELLGVGLILPLVNVITNPKIVYSGIYKTVGELFKLNEINQYVSFFSIALIAVYILKNIYLIAEYNLQYKFVYNGQRDLMVRVLRCYIKEDYIYHLNHNPMELQRNIINDVETVFQALLYLIQLLTEAMVCIALVAFLLITDLFSTLTVSCVIAVFALFFTLFYKKHSYVLGTIFRDAGADQLKWVNQSLSGIREIKITDTEDYFLNRFKDAADRLAKSRRKHSIIGIVPRPILESVMIVTLLTIVFISAGSGDDLNSLAPILSLFAVSAFRMLPSFNRITQAYNIIMASKASVIEVGNELEKVLKNEYRNDSDNKYYTEYSGANENKKNIKIETISYAYPGNVGKVLENVNIVLKNNKSTAFVGESGAGKSTLADILLGLLKPNEGNILYGTESIYDDLTAWHKKIGYIPQTIYLMDGSIMNNIAFGIDEGKIDVKRIYEVLKEAQLEEFVNSLKDGIHTRIGDRGAKLSGGQRQRIGIARALYFDPDIIIMDEATSALDGDTEQAVMDAVNDMRGKRTIVIIAHRLSTIKKCDYYYKVENKNVIATSYGDILNGC